MSGLPYFFLSYAHSAPSSEVAVSSMGAELTPPDAVVGEFFDDLCEAIAALERLPSKDGIGFIDMRISPGVDWNAATTEALGKAQVLVPLYSPSYFNKSWTMRERESFRLRLIEAGVDDVMRHIVPVLWTPFEPWRLDDDIKAALALGEDVPDYVENGMRVLSMLTTFRSQYEEMVNRVAARIIERSRHNLQPSDVPQVPEVAPRDPEFVVAVLASDEAHAPPPDHPGNVARYWRPFGERQALPIGEYTASVAERLGSATLVDDFAKVKGMLQRRPALILIDPWIVRAEGGRQLLTAALSLPQQWITPLLVIDGEDFIQSKVNAAVLAEAETACKAAGVARFRLVSRLAEFVDLLPKLITQARGRFLKHSPHYREASSTVERYTLRGDYTPPVTNGKWIDE